MSKCQVLLTDLIVAVPIFLLIVGLAFMLSNSQQTELEQSDQTFNLNTKATVFSDLLVRQPNLFTLNSTDIGIVEEPNVLSKDGLNLFSTIDYGFLKDKLSLSNLEFHLKFYYVNNTIIKEIGILPSGVYTSYGASRTLFEPIENKNVVMEMILWQKA